MNPYGMNPAAMRAKDEGDLNTLATLHYVWTALLGCSTLGIIGYFVVIAAVVAKAPPARTVARTTKRSRRAS